MVISAPLGIPFTAVFVTPFLAKTPQVAPSGKKNSSAGTTPFLVNSWPKPLEMAPSLRHWIYCVGLYMMYLFCLFSITHSYFLLVLNLKLPTKTGSKSKITQFVFSTTQHIQQLEREKHGDHLLACTIEFNACNFWNKWERKLKKHIESIHVNVFNVNNVNKKLQVHQI